jgi:orotidine-5'-phosphate decarboxylase
MAKFMGVIAVLVSCSALFAANKQVLPQSVVVARYVMVTSYYGNQIGDPNVPRDDRQAIANVENALRKWGRYIVVLRPENADIIVLVRAGRTAMVTPGVHIGTGSVGIDPNRGGVQIGGRRQTTTGVGVASEIGPAEDSLAVYDATIGTDSTPLWRETMSKGLQLPSVKLVKEFRRVVEEAAKKP